MLNWMHVGPLQRKVLGVVVVIIVVPMLLSGILTASWVTSHMDASIENWLRESSQMSLNWLRTLHHNEQLFADVLEETNHDVWRFDSSHSPVTPRLAPLAQELGISFIQVYGLDGRMLYSSSPVKMMWIPEPGRDEAVVRVSKGNRRLLAAVSVIEVPRHGKATYRMVLGALFDKPLLQRLGLMSGLKTRLFYSNGTKEFAKAFSEEESPSLRLRLPEEAFARLQNREEYFSPEAEGGRYWGLYTAVADADGHVEGVLFSGLLHRAGDQIFADRTTLTVAIAALGTLLAAITGLLLSRLVVRPVQELRNGVLRVAAQDFRASIPVRTKDELGDLGQAFNAMADSLREARDEQMHAFRSEKLTALGELSLAMAHEIRNPIGVINTAAQLLHKSEGDPGRQAALVRMIHEETARLNGLLRNFQQLSRHRSPQLSPIAPELPAERALGFALAGREDVTVLRDLGHGNQRVLADAELLQQAWANLINNALESIGTAPAELTLRSWLEKDGVYVALQDNGPGVPVELIPRLFEPFYTTKTHGSGLGLTIANTLVEANGGRLEYRPGQGGGACFVMRLVAATEGA